MASKHKSMCRFIFLIVFLSICIVGAAQKKPEKKLGLDVDKWADKLSKGELNEINSLGSLTNLLMEADTVRAFRFMDSVELSDKAKGYYFRTFFNMVKADFLYAKFALPVIHRDRASEELQRIKEQLIKLQADALDAVYHTEDNLQIGWVSFYSARRMRNFGEIGWAVMYSKNGVDHFEKVAYPVEPPVYTELAELLYEVREYEECIIYAKKGIEAWKKEDHEQSHKDSYKYKIRALNTIGNTFYRRNQHDSANAWYQQALQLAKNNKDTLLTGAILGNIGRSIYAQNKFDSAYSLFKTNYQNTKAESIYNDAANASLWAARANLARGNKVAALAEAREAIHLLGLWPSRPFLRDTYFTLTQIFRALGSYDSAFYYNDRYIALNDSLEKEVATSSLVISKAKLDNETNRYNIQNLNKQKRTQIVLRNFIIAGIVLLSLLILLVLNRNRLKTKMKMEMTEKQKKLMEQEIASAQTQLKMFTENIIEKTNLVEKLEQELKGREASEGQQAMIAELSQQTILTEDDWLKFKTLFEKIHPGFFIKLKDGFPDITLAEQRMAALIRLNLTTRQMSSMLGISVDSVHKTKQRLRMRLQLPSEVSLEKNIASV